MAEQVTEQQGNDKKSLGKWEKPMKVLAVLKTKGKEAAMTGYCFAKGLSYGLLGYAVDMQQIRQDSEIEVAIAKQHVEYHAMIAKLKAQALHIKSSDPEKRKQAEIAERQLAHAKVIDILADTGLEMLGVSASRMMIYKRDFLVKQKLDAIKKPEQKLTRAQELNGLFVEASPEEEQLKIALTEALKGHGGIEGVDIKEIVDSVLRTKISEITENIADKANVGFIGKMVSGSLFGTRSFEASKKRLNSERYAANLGEFIRDAKASEDSVRTVDNQVDLAELYVKCKKEKNMDPFYARVEALYTEAFALNKLEVNPHYKSKVGKQATLTERIAHATNNIIENLVSKDVAVQQEA